jgi:hypothetical protein
MLPQLTHLALTLSHTLSGAIPGSDLCVSTSVTAFTGHQGGLLRDQGIVLLLSVSIAFTMLVLDSLPADPLIRRRAHHERRRKQAARRAPGADRQLLLAAVWRCCWRCACSHSLGR